MRTTLHLSRENLFGIRAMPGDFWWERQCTLALQARDAERLTWLVDLAEAEEHAHADLAVVGA